MRKTEQKLWDRFRNKAPIRVLLLRVENVVGEPGFPDVLALVAGNTTLVELKAVAAPPVRPTTRLLGNDGLSIDQRNWHLAWNRAGGKSWILVGCGSFDHWLLPGRLADSINGMTCADLTQLAAATDWTSIFEVLGDKKR
jgi:hypothetical protein